MTRQCEPLTSLAAESANGTDRRSCNTVARSNQLPEMTLSRHPKPSSGLLRTHPPSRHPTHPVALRWGVCLRHDASWACHAEGVRREIGRRPRRQTSRPPWGSAAMLSHISVTPERALVANSGLPACLSRHAITPALSAGSRCPRSCDGNRFHGADKWRSFFFRAAWILCERPIWTGTCLTLIPVKTGRPGPGYCPVDQLAAPCS